MTKEKFYTLWTKHFTLPKTDALEEAVHSFSPFEKVLFWVLVVALAGSSLSILSHVNNLILVETPARGGSLVEGVLGSPRFINPILATSDADRDLLALVYSGLLKATPEGGLIADLAETYTVSEDGLIYSFIIREDAVFHDGEPVTADDVVFTVQKALDPTLKSPRRANWDGIVIEKVDEREVRFTLIRPYTPFLQNTTIGILPKHLWESLSAEQFSFSPLNINPVGSGPYRIAGIKKNSSGTPESYTLKAFRHYTLGRPYITTLTTRFYQTEDTLISAYTHNDVEAINSIAPEKIVTLDTKRIEQAPLPRIFAVFFNQNINQLFSHVEVRKALDIVLNKEAIVTQVLSGYGTAINSPIPSGSIERTTAPTVSESLTDEERMAEARAILERNGWTFNEEEGLWQANKKGNLEFSLSTSNVPELKAAAEIVKARWEALGVKVTLKIFEVGNLNQNVIRPREYDALLFGEVVGRELDLFAFWHSSQRNDPGLNIAQYANITADKLLETGRTILDATERNNKYLEFEKEVQSDIPAIFLYSPDFIYVFPDRVKGLRLGSVTTSGERFLNVHQWHIATDNVWSIFSR